MSIQDYLQKQQDAANRRERLIGLVAVWYRPVLAVVLCVVLLFVWGYRRSKPSAAPAADAYTQADLYYMSSQYPEAVDAFGKALTQGGLDDERLRTAYVKLALSLEKLDRYDDAIKSYQEVIRRFPTSEEANHAQADVERIKLHHGLK